VKILVDGTLRMTDNILLLLETCHRYVPVWQDILTHIMSTVISILGLDFYGETGLDMSVETSVKGGSSSIFLVRTAAFLYQKFIMKLVV
jgi:hypothetical protein